MRIAISGAGRSGKDTAAECLAGITGLAYSAGTSYWARELVYSEYQAVSPGRYSNSHECWLDRHSDRKFWANAIGKFNERDPVALYRECLENQNFLTGVRWKREMDAIRTAGLVDLWLFIDRPGYVEETCEITAGDCDITIHNCGTEEQFKGKLSRLASVMLAGRTRLPPLGRAG